MDIFTINLDSRSDRWNRVMAIQRLYPWANFYRLPAVSIPMYATAACTVSHQLACFLASVDGRTEITVAEDDLEPTRFFGDWPAIVEKARALGLDYVVGAVATSEDHTIRGTMGNADVGVHGVWANDQVMLVEAKNGRGTHLITYFESAFQKIMNLQFGVPIDAALGLHPELRGGFAFPFVAVQGEGFSDLCHRPYVTGSLYERAAEVWAGRLDFTPNLPWSDLLRPVVPVSKGLESVCKITKRDVIAGRNPKSTPFDPALLEGFLNG